jgi:predicted acetyltransferase
MPELIAPTTGLHAAWLAARDDWGRDVHQPGSGVHPDDDVDSPAGFAALVERLGKFEDRTRALPAGKVHCTYRWIVENDRILGAIALRHHLNDYLRQVGGHIGYGVRPAERRKGVATWALGEMLTEARRLDLTRVMLTCDVENKASARTIEHHGGELEEERDTDLGRARVYWIALS